jgi:hypothetical protein
MDLIVNNLYLGDIQGASNMSMLKKNVFLFNFQVYRESLISCK